MADRFFYDVRQYGLIKNTAGNILVLQLPAHCGDVANMWTLPGGKLEPDDTPESGLIREITEETGLAVQDVNLMTARRWATDNSEKLALFYTATAAKDDLLLSSEHKAGRWVDATQAAQLSFYRAEVGTVVLGGF